MTAPETLLELAGRVGATGPDRELDECIMYATSFIIVDNPKPYTASLDAAKSLMPKGMLVEVYQQSGDGLNWMTKAIFADGSFVLGYGFTEEGSRCAAALGARAQPKDSK